MRSTVLCLALGSLAQFGMTGCIPPPGSEPATTERGTIVTQAAAMQDTAHVGDTVTLAASVSGDARGVSYSWFQVAGAGVRLLNAKSASTSFEAPSVETAQTLRFRVSTRNDAGDVGNAVTEVSIDADPEFGAGGPDASSGSDGDSDRPVANAGPDLQANPGDTVTLNGNTSTGVDLRFLWTQTDGSRITLDGGDSAIVTFIAPTPAGSTATGDDSTFLDGTASGEVFEFELRVTDSLGQTSSDRVRVTVSPKPDAGGEGGTESVSATRVRFSTTLGNFTIELDADNAPISVANFLQYVDDDFYNGTIFHRVIPGFVVQGGGFLPGLVEKDTRDPIVNEGDNGLKNDRVTVAMARTTDPDSATSQFYVNLVDNESLNPSSGSAGYAVFGRVVEGMSVIDRIATVDTTTRNGFNNVPVDVITINSVERVATP